MWTPEATLIPSGCAPRHFSSPVFQGMFPLLHHICSNLCDGSLALLINFSAERPEDFPSRSGPWTSSALGAWQPCFQSNRSLSLNENCRRPTRKTDPSDLSHVWQGGASLATLSPTALALPNTVSNIASPAQLFCHRRRARSRREGCGLGLTHISPGSLWQNQVGVPHELFQSWMHTDDHTGALGKANDQTCPRLVHLGMAIVQFPRGL